MTVINNVSRKLLADLLGNDHDNRIMAERHLLAMLANAPSPKALQEERIITERQLSAIKAQEPVAEIALSDDGYKIGLLGALRNHRLPIGTKLYAAPVVSGRNTMDSGVCVTDCRSSDGVAVGIIDAVITLARVFNGREVTPAVEEALIDLRSDEDVISMISFTHVANGQGVPDERIIPTSAELIQWAWEEEPEETRFQEGYNAAKRWVKMQIEAGIAAPAAPAADTGIVDMYRHLQKVTPYRFKKIQDASITDGGDVMYFHKDRFDAALLADMAAHRAKGVV